MKKVNTDIERLVLFKMIDLFVDAKKNNYFS